MTNTLSRSDADAVARAAAALSHPTRALVIAALTTGRGSPGQLARTIGGSVPAVSHHFNALSRAGIIRRAGTKASRGTIEHFYELSSRGEALAGQLQPLAAAMRRPSRRSR